MRLGGPYDSHSPNDSLDVLGQLRLSGFTAQGTTGRCFRVVWFHHNPPACITTYVSCANISTQCGGVVVPPHVD